MSDPQHDKKQHLSNCVLAMKELNMAIQHVEKANSNMVEKQEKTKALIGGATTKSHQELKMLLAAKIGELYLEIPHEASY